MIFTLETDFIELYKLLKVTGLCESGGQAKSVINAGEVKVDGTVEVRKANKIRRGQIVEFQGARIQVQ